MQEEYLTPLEVAKMLKVSDRTVIRWCAEGKLNAIQVGATKKSKWRISVTNFRSNNGE